VANIVLVIHFAIVLFITAGLPVIVLGAALRWHWVRKRRWRMLHLAAAVFVAAEALAGTACPLTVLEDALRGSEQRTGFVERWIERIMFYDLPPWSFVVAYTVYAILVAVTWIKIPVESTRHDAIRRH
jgi:hypothetical protein